MRVNIVLEGQTEETFCREILRPHLAALNVFLAAHLVTTARELGRLGRGGGSGYAKYKTDIVRWLKQERNNRDVRFTSMIDLYALPQDFPGYSEARGIADPYKRVEYLEREFREDINDTRFVPYIQLHEFEALLLADPQAFDYAFPKRSDAVNRLVADIAGLNNPELVNDDPTDAPSKRIIRCIPEYERMKVSAGPLVALHIGLSKLRQKCQHFNSWLGLLESSIEGQGQQLVIPVVT